jgi:hypothetical protein
MLAIEREGLYIKSGDEDSVLCPGDRNVYTLIYIQSFVLNTCTRTRSTEMLDELSTEMLDELAFAM